MIRLSFGANRLKIDIKELQETYSVCRAVILKEGRITLYYDTFPRWMVFANFVKSCSTQLGLVNNVDYKWYFVYTPVPSVNYCDGLGRCFRLVCIYACAAVFFDVTVFSVNKDLYKQVVRNIRGAISGGSTTKIIGCPSIWPLWIDVLGTKANLNAGFDLVSKLRW